MSGSDYVLHFLWIGFVTVLVNIAMFLYAMNPLISTFMEQNAKVVSKVNLIQEAIKIKDVVRIGLTAYSPRRIETDSSPFVTASMEKVKVGGIAVSRDLFENGFTFGKRVYIKGYGVFVINDLMNARFQHRMDIFMFNTKKAIKFGYKRNVIAVLIL